MIDEPNAFLRGRANDAKFLPLPLIFFRSVAEEVYSENEIQCLNHLYRTVRTPNVSKKLGNDQEIQIAMGQSFPFRSGPER